MTGISIDEKVPFPVRKRKGAPLKYPWRELPVGGSFFVKDGKLLSFRSMCGVRGRIDGNTYRCREVEGGIRVWRMA